MLDSVNGDTLFASVKMLVEVPARKTILLLESTSDCQCLAAHIADGATTLPCHGVRNLMEAMRLVESAAIDGVLAIRDRDWVDMLEEKLPANVFLTDLYDLDASIAIKTDVGRRVIYAYGNQSEVESYCRSHGVETPLTVAEHIVADLGRLRLISHREGLQLSLERYPVHEVADAESGSIDVERMIDLAKRRSPGCTVSDEEIREGLDGMEAIAVERSCVGHDLAAALGFLIWNAWKGGRVSSDVVLRSIRAALSCAELWTLAVYKSVRDWEVATGWQVWACGPT